MNIICASTQRLAEPETGVFKQNKNKELRSPDTVLGICELMTIIEFLWKWIHMARYWLILKQDGAIWLRIISKPLLPPKGGYERPLL